MPFSFSASITRWNPSVSSVSGSLTTFSSAADIIFSLCVVPAAFVIRAGHSIEEIAVLLNMRGQSHRVFAHQPLGCVGITLLQGGDDGAMIDDGALCTIVLGHRYGANRAHVDEQVVGQAGHQLHAAHSD